MNIPDLDHNQKAALDQFLATPAIILAGMSQEEIEFEFQRMATRTLITRDFVDGLISPDQFENAMHELGVDIYHAQKQWDRGIRFV